MRLQFFRLNYVFVFFGRVRTYVHTYFQTYIHSYFHTFILSYFHTFILSYFHTFILSYFHTFIHSYVRTYIHSCIHIFIHSYIHLSATLKLARHVHAQCGAKLYTHGHATLSACVPASFACRHASFSLRHDDWRRTHLSTLCRCFLRVLVVAHRSEFGVLASPEMYEEFDSSGRYKLKVLVLQVDFSRTELKSHLNKHVTRFFHFVRLLTLVCAARQWCRCCEIAPWCCRAIASRTQIVPGKGRANKGDEAS